MSIWVQLTFHGTASLCVPEHPAKTNVLHSGFSVPASAVRAILLHRLSEIDKSLGDRAFADPAFRAWPLLPCGATQTKSDLFPVRISLSHKVAKLSEPGKSQRDDFQDSAIEPYDWTKLPKGSPLKSTDGVLLTSQGKEPLLWKSSRMPRVISAHGVHNDPELGRNLFSLEAMAPLQWKGLLHLPDTTYLDQLKASLAENPMVAFGKRRSVMGHGELTLSEAMLTLPYSNPDLNQTVLISQSPIAIKGLVKGCDPSEVLLHEATTWLDSLGLDAKIVRCEAAMGLRFGWNRHEGQGLESALPVILPGAVFILNRKISEQQLQQLLVSGLGDHFERGFGNILPHPGRAIDHFDFSIKVHRPPSISKHSRELFQKVIHLVDSGKAHFSTSQISHFATLLTSSEEGEKLSMDFLQHQLKERPARFANAWKDSSDVLSDIAKSWGYIERRSDVEKALRFLMDASAISVDRSK